MAAKTTKTKAKAKTAAKSKTAAKPKVTAKATAAAKPKTATKPKAATKAAAKPKAAAKSKTTAKAKAPARKKAASNGAKTFDTPKFQDFTIRDNSGVVGHVRLKPNAVAWKPKSGKAYQQITMDQLAAFAAEHGRAVQN